MPPANVLCYLEVLLCHRGDKLKVLASNSGTQGTKTHHDSPFFFFIRKLITASLK